MNISGKIKKILPGTAYGSWTVLSFSHVQPNRAKQAYWNCKCVCGTEKPVSGTSLRLGISTQCKSCSSRDSAKKNLRYRQNAPHLYIISCGDYIKIGSATDVDVRIASIQASNPYRVCVEKVYLNKGPLEKRIHEKFNQWNHRGEWFDSIILPRVLGFCQRAGKGGACEIV